MSTPDETTWVIRRKQDPPKEKPGLITRIGNFIRSIPEWIHNAADWARHQWNNLKHYVGIGGRNTTIAGVDKRLLHIAAAIGMTNDKESMTCTDGMRSKHATYGAANSRHKLGLALDLRVRDFPPGVRGKRASERFVSDIATVLGYGRSNLRDTIVASNHNVGRGPHMHIQIGPTALGHVGFTKAGTDVAAAEQRLLKTISPEKLAKIKATRMPDKFGNSTREKYPGYGDRNPSGKPKLVAANHPLQHSAKKPPRDHEKQPPAQWQIRSSSPHA